MSLIFMVYVNELSLREEAQEESRLGWRKGPMLGIKVYWDDSLSWWITMHVQESRRLVSKRALPLLVVVVVVVNGIGSSY